MGIGSNLWSWHSAHAAVSAEESARGGIHAVISQFGAESIESQPCCEPLFFPAFEQISCDLRPD